MVADALDVDQGGVGDAEQAHLAGQGDILGHRPSEGGDHPAVGDGGIPDLLDAVDVAGEAGGDDPLAGVLGEQGAQDLAHRRLGGGVARLLGVGGVGQQQADARPRGQGADGGQVGDPPVDRREVDLEVARVQDHALGGVEGGGEAVGHRVGDGDELAVEGPNRRAPSATGDELGAVEEAGLLDPVPGQAQGELRPEDREPQVAEQVGQATHVVLVAVGDDVIPPPVGVLPQPGEVGQDQVDAEHLRLSGNIRPQSRIHDAVVLDDALAGSSRADLSLVRRGR